MIRFISLLVSIPIIILIAAFAYKNAQLVFIDLFLYQVNLPLAVLILLALLVGVILGYLLNLLTLLNLKQRLYRLKHKKETLEGLSNVLNKSDK
jgi:uncharacterized integral membrane protein